MRRGEAAGRLLLQQVRRGHDDADPAVGSQGVGEPVQRHEVARVEPVLAGARDDLDRPDRPAPEGCSHRLLATAGRRVRQRRQPEVEAQSQGRDRQRSDHEQAEGAQPQPQGTPEHIARPPAPERGLAGRARAAVMTRARGTVEARTPAGRGERAAG